MIELDVAQRKLELLVSSARSKAAVPSEPRAAARAGYGGFIRPCAAAHQGADLDFSGKSGAFVPRDNH